MTPSTQTEKMAENIAAILPDTNEIEILRKKTVIKLSKEALESEYRRGWKFASMK